MELKRLAGMLIVGSFLFVGPALHAFGQAADAPQPDDMLQGTMNFRLGNYEEALDDLTRARIKDPRSSIAAYYLGATLKKMQQYNKALPHLMEAVTLQPAAKEAYLELADVYYALNRYDDALKALESSEREGVEPAQTAYLKGLVLVKKGKFQEAQDSFERSKALDSAYLMGAAMVKRRALPETSSERPKTLESPLANAADYQVALLYLRQGKKAEARDLLNAVAERDRESDVGQMAKQQANALSKPMQTGQRFSAMVGAQYQYDSNVILKPDNAASTATISNQSDTAVVVTALAEYAPVLKASYSLKLQYALYASRYQMLSAYDVMSNTFGMSPGFAIGDGALSFPLSYNMTAVDGKDYLKAFGVAPVYVFTPAEGQQAHISLRFQQKDFQQPVTLPDEDRDSTEAAMGISWYWLFAQQKGFVNARYEINREDATGNNWSYLGNRISAGILYPAGSSLKLSLGIEAYLQSYENVHTSFNVQRKDTTVTATAQALYALTRNVDVNLQYVYMKDDSNIDVYAFSKNIIGIGLYARF